MFFFILAGNSSEAKTFLSKGAQVVMRMRGLPYDCTANDVVSFKYLRNLKYINTVSLYY